MDTENTKTTMPFNLQFFAESETPAGSEANNDNNTSENTDGTGKNDNKDVDIEKIAEEAKEKKEAAILKSYFQQKGMTKEEAEEAFKTWKDTKAAEAKAAEDSKKATEDAKEQAVKDAEAKAEAATKALNNMIIQNALEKQAIALGVNPERLDIALKLANLENITITDGKVDEDASKKEIEAILGKLPELKKVENNNGFTFGAQKTDTSGTTNNTKNMTYRQKLEAQMNMSK